MHSSESVSRSKRNISQTAYRELWLQLVLRPGLEELRDRPRGSGEKAWGLGKHKNPKLILRISNKDKQKPPKSRNGAREITQQLHASVQM